MTTMVRLNVKNESNIVVLNPADEPTGRRDSSRGRADAYKAKLHRQMSEPLVRLQDKTRVSLLKCLQDMFDKIDDALFELAEKATSNCEQNIFFESMREVRLKRIDTEAQYADLFGNGFVALFNQTGVSSQASFTQEPSLDSSLSLMADDAVEEMVAFDAMVAKAEKHLSQPLAELYARIGSLSNTEINRFNNPLGPQRLCDIFCDACALFTIDIKARLVVFKLYDKHVIATLEKLYLQANEQLINDNVLPDFRSSQHRAGRGAQSQHGRANHIAQPNSQAIPQQLSQQGVQQGHPQDVLQLLQHFNMAGAGMMPGAVNGSAQLLPVSATPAVGHELLVQLLTSIQRDPARLPGYNDILSNGPGVLMPGQLTNGLQQSLQAMTEGGDHSIGRSDRDVIGLVALLFQLVLDDRSLAEPMKAAISRLQIPVIKVAMQDAGFFNEKAHPARRLLNEMTTAALGWVAEDGYQNDSLYQCVCATVERVSNDFYDDTGLFSDVLADFISFVENEKKRASLREKRVVDAEAGRDQSESARSYVSALIKSRAIDDTVPAFVSKMVESSWNNMLFLTYLKKGLESAEWQSAVVAMDDLLWTVAPQRSMSDRTEIMRRIPSLLKTLRQGLNIINYDGYAAGEFFAHLEHLHMEVMQRSVPLKAEESAATSQVDVNDSDVNKSASSSSDSEVLVSQSLEANGDENTPPLVDENSPYFAKAKMLGVGQWVEFIDNEKKTRCRLVAILRNSGKRIFANRTGVKSGEYTVQALALRLEQESLELLEDAQLFDKALSSIIDDLRQSRASTSSHA